MNNTSSIPGALLPVMLPLLWNFCLPVWGQNAVSPPYAREFVQAFLLPGNEPDTYGLRLEQYSERAFSYTPAAQNIRAEVRDAAGHLVQSRAQITLLPQPPAIPEYGPLHRKNDPPGMTWIGLRWEPSTLKPGLYALQIAVPVNGTDTATGKPIVLSEPTASLRVYVPPLPNQRPSQSPGQRFLCLPGWEEDLPYLDAQGRVVPRARLALKIVTLKRIDRSGRWPMLYFTAEGCRGQFHIENGGPLSALPGLKPLVEDDTARRLRAKYEGKQVWGYGGLNGECVTASAEERGSLGTGIQTPYTLRHLVRIAAEPVELAIGASPNVLGGYRQSAFITSRPLVAVLERPRRAQVLGFSYVSAGKGRKRIRQTADGMPLLQTSDCLGLYAEFADAWDFERSYSLLSPRQAGAHWPRSMRKAVLAGELRVGMTPDMVAWTLGWPSDYGTAAQVKAQTAWKYDNLQPFHFWVYFKNGKAASFGPDGQLP